MRTSIIETKSTIRVEKNIALSPFGYMPRRRAWYIRFTDIRLIIKMLILMLMIASMSIASCTNNQTTQMAKRSIAPSLSWVEMASDVVRYG